MLASPFQLLELNIISAQDLAPVSKSIKAYAVAWLNPERKLTTQIDPNGQNNPTWNEKFVFRVDDDFLTSDESLIIIEIYASAWLRDILIGTVTVLASNLLPRSINTRKSKIRFVALQVRRPSGRPQGILNIGVNLVDSTMRSMPMYSELSASAVGYWDVMDPKKPKLQQNETNNNDSSCKLLTLQRSQSEKNDSTINDYAYNCSKENGYDEGGDDCQGSEVGMPMAKKGVIMNMNGSLCSDVGPSPSVVAAAIAKGLYPLPMMTAPRKPGNLVFQDWPEERGGLTAVYDHLGKNNENKKVRHVHSIPKGKGQKHRKGSSDGGLFSCFGTAMGCEFSITCGGGHGNRKKRYEGGSKAPPTAESELTYDESYI